MADMVTLVCPVGADTGMISHGTTTYVPYPEDHTNPLGRLLVDVPREIAGFFLGVGGFYMAKVTAPAAERAPAAFVRMYHPDGGVCDAYDREDGYHLVPNGPAVAEMRAHGFMVEGEEPKAEAPKVVPAEAYEAAAERISDLESKFREAMRDGKFARDAKDVLEGERDALKARVAELEALVGAKPEDAAKPKDEPATA